MRIIVITGMDRSGTTFLANLLSRAPDVEAQHEFFGDAAYIPLSYYQPNHPYLELQLRQQRQELVARFPQLHTFVDVNSNLRFSLETVRRALDVSLCFQLVRNGRDVVRSIYLENIYSARAKGIQLIPNEPSTFDLFSTYSRFEKLCWRWSDTVSRLLDEGLNVLQLERIVSDYQYLRERLLEPSNIHLEPDVWHALKNRRLNRRRVGLKDRLRGRPVKLTWTPKHEASFMSICGETMRALGYV